MERKLLCLFLVLLINEELNRFNVYCIFQQLDLGSTLIVQTGLFFISYKIFLNKRFAMIFHSSI